MLAVGTRRPLTVNHGRAASRARKASPGGPGDLRVSGFGTLGMQRSDVPAGWGSVKRHGMNGFAMALTHASALREPPVMALPSCVNWTQAGDALRGAEPGVRRG